MLCGGPLRRTNQNGSRNSRKIVARRRRPIYSLSISLRRSEIDAQSQVLRTKSRMRTPHLTPPVYRTYSSELARLNRQNLLLSAHAGRRPAPGQRRRGNLGISLSEAMSFNPARSIILTCRRFRNAITPRLERARNDRLTASREIPM